MTERRIRIAGVLESVASACDFVEAEARRAGLDEQAAHNCCLSVDEACTNIVEHGYAASCRDCVIDISCHTDDGHFVITIVDNSPAFDPLTVPDPDTKSPLANREPGGWGIYFIKKLMDRVHYTYEGMQNRLVMLKRIKPSTPQMDTLANAQRQPIRVDEIKPKVKLIAPSGRLDAMQSRDLAALLIRQFETGNKWLILDLSEVEYISSAGFKALVSAWQRTRELKGEFVLTSLNPRVREVMQLIGLDLVFSIAETPEQAIKSFGGSK